MFCGYIERDIPYHVRSDIASGFHCCYVNKHKEKKTTKTEDDYRFSFIRSFHVCQVFIFVISLSATLVHCSVLRRQRQFMLLLLVDNALPTFYTTNKSIHSERKYYGRCVCVCVSASAFSSVTVAPAISAPSENTNTKIPYGILPSRNF